MAYTNAWSVSIPAGTAAANSADDQLRQLRLDLQERLNDLAIDWTVDPIVMRLKALGRWRHWSEGMIEAGATTAWTQADTGAHVHPTGTATTIRFVYPLIMQTGSVLTTISLRVYRDSGATVSFTAHRVSSAGSRTLLGTSTSGTVGWHDLGLTITHTILADEIYYIYLTLTSDGSNANSARLAGYQMT